MKHEDYKIRIHYDLSHRIIHRMPLEEGANKNGH